MAQSSSSMHEGRSPGLAAGSLFSHQTPVTALRGKKMGMRSGEGQRGRRVRRGERCSGLVGGWVGGDGLWGYTPMFKSCHVALIHPASLKRGKEQEGLS